MAAALRRQPGTLKASEDEKTRNHQARFFIGASLTRRDVSEAAAGVPAGWLEAAEVLANGPEEAVVAERPGDPLGASGGEIGEADGDQGEFFPAASVHGRLRDKAGSNPQLIAISAWRDGGLHPKGAAGEGGARELRWALVRGLILGWWCRR